MTPEQLEALCRDDVRAAIERNIDRDPVEVALDRSIPFAADVATQVKYLQRARRKLPSWYDARCIIPPLAFEQSSGEEAARNKEIAGRTALDLTCGLGVDTAVMASRFERVVSLERDPVTAAAARENLRRMGIGNVEVVDASAEEFVAATDLRFDWCIADPDRRASDGKKMVLLEDCSPNILTIMPSLQRIADRILLKVSPVFDVDEAFRLFPGCSVEVVSSGGECKEVLIRLDGQEPAITATILGKGRFSIPCARRTMPPAQTFDPEAYRWLAIPDTALQKARLAVEYCAPFAYIEDDNGCAFCRQRPDDSFLGRVFEIESVGRYEPRTLRRQLKGLRTTLLLRGARIQAQQVRRQLALRDGCDCTLAITHAAGKIWAIKLK